MKKGFTIVETLVAITVLMIAVVGPLSIAGKGLNAALYARDQMIASFLAQETMETMKNVRDNNLVTSKVWTNGYSGCLQNSPGSPCDADPTDNPYPSDGSSFNAFTCNYSYRGSLWCPLYEKTDGSGAVVGYTHSSGGAQTIFYRRFYMTFNAANAEEAFITVSVAWDEGTVPNEVDLSSALSDTRR